MGAVGPPVGTLLASNVSHPLNDLGTPLAWDVGAFGSIGVEERRSLVMTTGIGGNGA